MNMRIAVMMCLILISLFACTKNRHDVSNLKEENSTQQIAEEQRDVSNDIEEQIPIQETNEPEIINIEELKQYLIDYFPDDNFQLLEESLDVNYRKINFAVHYINNDLLICDKIVGFEIIDGLFNRYLLVEDFRFICIDNSILFDFSKGYTGIYGFAFSYSYPKVAGYTPGINVDTYFDNGKRVADVFTIRWNEGSKTFEENIW